MSTIQSWDPSVPLPTPKPDHSGARPPKSRLAYFLWRQKMLFEATFVFTYLEPWEKTLLLTIGFIVSFLLFSAIFRYLPQHMMLMHSRTVYYLYGKQDAASGMDYTTRLTQWFFDSFSTMVTAATSATPAGPGNAGAAAGVVGGGLLNEL